MFIRMRGHGTKWKLASIRRNEEQQTCGIKLHFPASHDYFKENQVFKKEFCNFSISTESINPYGDQSHVSGFRNSNN